jgi:hypothetical protein
MVYTAGMEESKPAAPDLIVKYPPEENGFAAGGDCAYAVIYVRPETNKVLYERAIVAGIRGMGRPIYIANLSGSLFLRDRILESHYPSQFRFASDPCGEMALYPQMIPVFERHFRVSFDRSPLIGSFDAVKLLGLGAEDLFETIVPEEDFLDSWGQEFKKISGFIVANPNLPAILKRYVPAASVFVVAVRSQAPARPDFFSALNQAIYSQIVARKETPVLDGEKLDSLVWSEKIRRTYHISSNHLMAMLDMADFVYLDDRRRLDIADTPLGRKLIGDGGLTREKLAELSRSQLALVGPWGEKSLAYLPVCAQGKSVEEIASMLREA